MADAEAAYKLAVARGEPQEVTVELLKVWLDAQKQEQGEPEPVPVPALEDIASCITDPVEPSLVIDPIDKPESFSR